MARNICLAMNLASWSSYFSARHPKYRIINYLILSDHTSGGSYSVVLSTADYDIPISFYRSPINPIEFLRFRLMIPISV